MIFRPAKALALGLSALLLGAAPPPEPELVAGIVALRMHNPREARVHLMNAIRANPGDGLARALQARTALLLGDGGGAAEEVRQARAAGFPVGRTRHLMAEALLLQGRPEAAIAEAAPAGVPLRYSAYAARVRAQAQAAQGHISEAAAEFNAALALAPNDAAVWTDIGRFRQATGEIAGAIAASAQAVAADPRDPNALVLRGQMVRGQFGLVAALPWFDRAIAVDPGHVGALLERAATLGDLGRNRAMLAATRAALSLDPGNARAYYLQAVMAARAGRFDLARSLMTRVGGRMDDVPAALLVQATLAVRAGAYEQAISALDRLLAAQPDNFSARRLLGLAYWRRGDPAAAIAALASLAARNDSYALALTGRAHERLGDRAAAAPFLDRAALPVRRGEAVIDPGVPLAQLAQEAAADPGRATRVVRYVRGLLIAGNGVSALAQAERLFADNPGAPGAPMLVGDVLAAQGRWADAARAYAESANLEFSEAVALRLADAQRLAGDAAAGAATLSLFLDQHPRSIPALNLASDMMLAASRWDRAIAILNSVRARIGNGDSALLNNLAWGWAGRGDGAQAIRFARAAYLRSPANPALADNLGWLIARGEDEQAYGVALIEQAVAISPRDPGLRWHLAQAYAAVGRIAEARASAWLAAADPGFPMREDARALAGEL